MRYTRILGIVFSICFFLALVSGRGDETFEPVRVAEKMVSDLEKPLGFEQDSVLKVSVDDMTLGPIEKHVSLFDFLAGRVRYTTRVTVTPVLEGTTHIVRTNPFSFDIEATRPEQVNAIAEEKVASLQQAMQNSMKLKGWLA